MMPEFRRDIFLVMGSLTPSPDVHDLDRLKRASPVLCEERLYPRRLEKVEGLVAAQLTAWTRPRVAVHVGPSVDAAVEATVARHPGDTLREGREEGGGGRGESSDAMQG